MKYIAKRSLYGDYGRVVPGQVFEVPDYQVQEMQNLEAAGVIERYIPRAPINRKAYTVYQNKALTTAPNVGNAQVKTEAQSSLNVSPQANNRSKH